MVAPTILGADGRPVVTGGEPRRIPVLGGPLDGTRMLRGTGRPSMAVHVPPTGEGEPDLWLGHTYMDGKWRFVGWMDGTKRVIAAEGSDEYEAINRDRAAQIQRVRGLAGETRQTATPVEFEGMS